MYQERPASLPGAVRWSSVAPVGATPTRVLPDGCLDLLWSSRAGLLVAGPDRTAYLSVVAPGDRWVGLRLPPGVGPAVVGVPADELRDRRVSLADLWGQAAAERVARLVADGVAPIPPRAGDRTGWAVGAPPAARVGPAGAANHPAPETVASVLEAVAVERLRRAGGPDPVGRRVAARLAAGATVAATAAEVGLGARALHRRCRHLFGYGPKTLARILRMRRALDLARAGTPLAEVAARAGYADQAHLTRDVRALTGLPPRALLYP
ncbi:helix-turn-helix domain-containing protein [Micromonospora fluostatini]|uniref:helix-turn-helix domain-containing protein n=1 Tax=Micromonospora sp. JCM 30529 TaxID=3421643 RepID=UPI003D180B2A